MRTKTIEKEVSFQSIASELADAFTNDKRTDGATFYKIKDDAPEWIQRDNASGESLSLRFHSAVDSRLLDDWIYEQAHYLANKIASDYDHESADAARDNVSEMADSLVDVYNTDLCKWLASHLYNIGLCDEAAEEMGYDKERGIIGLIQLGQYKALEAIANCLINEIETELERRENA